MTQKKRWRRRLAAALGGLVILGSVGVGVVWWQYFRKDPQFLEEKERTDQVQKELDDLFADEDLDEEPGAER